MGTNADFRYFFILECLCEIPVREFLERNEEYLLSKVRQSQTFVFKLGSATNSTKKGGSLKLGVGNSISA